MELIFSFYPAIGISKPSRKTSGHGFLARRGRKSESESGRRYFLAGEIDGVFDNTNSRIYKEHVKIGGTPN
ncbi:MAG: hypothetical protein U5O15_00345 [Candidatus Krumholzibacteriota bacterium]|nr:hypothetical protein [Candidatus Krumholzibacteriota bacterium]